MVCVSRAIQAGLEATSQIQGPNCQLINKRLDGCAICHDVGYGGRVGTYVTQGWSTGRRREKRGGLGGKIVGISQTW